MNAERKDQAQPAQTLVLRDRNFYAARAYENIAKRIMGQKTPLMKI